MEFEQEPRHHLLYWQIRSVEEHALSGAPLDVVGSNQLGGVYEGDVLWIVTLSDELELLLCGRLIVGDITGYGEARQRIADPMLWQAEFYAFPEPGTEEPLFLINFEGLADSLRFENTDPDRFVTEDGKLNPAQLTQMRTLTEESAEMLSVIWFRMTEASGDHTPEEAFEHFAALAEETPDDTMARYNLGVVLDQLGRTEEAEAEFRESARLDKNNYSAWYNLGSILLQQGREREAVDAFNSAILANYEFAPAHFMLGMAYASAGDRVAAIEATTNGIAIDPDDPGAHLNIGIFRYELGRHRESLEALDRSIALECENDSAHFYKGLNWRELGDLEKEIGSYREAVMINPMHFDAMLALGAAYALASGENPESVRYIVSEGSLDLQDPEQGFYIGMASIALGDRQLPVSQANMLDEKDPLLAERLRRHIPE